MENVCLNIGRRPEGAQEAQGYKSAIAPASRPKAPATLAGHYASALNDVLLIAACVAFVAGGLALVLIRPKDFRPAGAATASGAERPAASGLANAWPAPRPAGSWPPRRPDAGWHLVSPDDVPLPVVLGLDPRDHDLAHSCPPA